MKSLLAQKIKSARILNAMPQEELGNQVGVSKQMISKYEKELAVPSSSVLIKLAKFLKVKPDYFFTPDLVRLDKVNFRKKSSFPIKRQNALKEEIKLRLSNYIEIENILGIENTFKVSDYKNQINSIGEIEDLVIKLRNQWEIGLDPLHNITQLLEDNEIKVIEIEESEKKFDGLAALIDNKYALIAINKSFPLERKRFTLLHELGHLLLDLPVCDVSTEESFCNRFAGEFLFPKQSVFKEFGEKRSHISSIELEEIQKKYGISISAIIYRLMDCGVISKSKQASFHIKINSNNKLKEWAHKQRFQTPEVSNRFEQLVYRALSQELISGSKAAALLNVKLDEVLEKT